MQGAITLLLTGINLQALTGRCGVLLGKPMSSSGRFSTVMTMVMMRITFVPNLKMWTMLYRYAIKNSGHSGNMDHG